MKPAQLLLVFLLHITALAGAQSVVHTEVLVVGGGAGGSAAGIQCARMGVKTIIAEPTVWLGGMLSAAGVSAFDGNHNLPSGIWAEFRSRLYKVYGGPGKVATGWVSNTLFEPHAGDSILKSMAAAEPALTVHYRLEFRHTIVKRNKVMGAVFYDAQRKKKITIYARQTIDATELGDVMADAGIPFDVGLEASALTGEDVNVPASVDIIQDMTYAAVLKDYGPKADCTIARPAEYDPMEFDGCCNQFCSHPSKLTSNVDAKKMLDYGRLPNGKYMLNWPGKGNDIYLNLIPMNVAEREAALKKARAKTLRFIYFLQTQFGFKNLGLANDEFPTADRLPLMPYHREGRRMQGLVRFKVQHISKPFNQPEALYRTGIAVGDYPIDHHHRENPLAPQHLGFYPVPSFNVPLGALIPQKMEGIIVAEKGISVSNVVNGTTRLQPCVMLTGQAAGTLAALCVKNKKQARQVPVREVQTTLLKAGAYIMPYFDVKPEHPHFLSIQKIGATGILRGKGEPYQWANRTWFHPDSLVNGEEWHTNLQPYKPGGTAKPGHLSVRDALEGIASPENAEEGYALLRILVEQNWHRWGLKDLDWERKITRAEMAVLLDKTLDPFHTKQVDHRGKFNP